MATFLDVGLFEHFSTLFTFLLLFVVIYGFLSSTKIIKLGDGSKGLYAIIALAAAFLSIMSKGMVSFITTLTPWFTAFIIFMFLVFFVLRMWTGDDDGLFKSLVTQEKALYWVLIVIFIIILIASLSSTFGQKLLDDSPDTVSSSNTAAPTSKQVISDDGSVTVIVDNSGSATGQQVPTGSSGYVNNPQAQGATATDDFNQNVLSTFVHPKILGLLLMMIVGFFTISFLAKTTIDPN